MFEIDKKRFKGSRKAGLLFSIIGVLILGVCVFIIINTNNKKNGMDKKATAIGMDENYSYDSDGNGTYQPIFYYKVDNQTYSCKSSTSSSFEPSENSTIYYDSKNPSKCISEYELSTVKFVYIGVALGALSLGIGGFLLLNNIKAKKKFKALATSGKLIKGVPYHLQQTKTALNGHYGQKIVASYEGPNGLTQEYVGETRYDLDGRDGSDLVDLLIDPNNPKVFYIDFDIKYSGDVQVEINETQTPEQKEIEAFVERQEEKTLQQQTVVATNTIQNTNMTPQQTMAPQQPAQINNNMNQQMVNNMDPQQVAANIPQNNNQTTLDDFGFFASGPVENNNRFSGTQGENH